MGVATSFDGAATAMRMERRAALSPSLSNGAMFSL
jgi:hypothetical protein